MIRGVSSRKRRNHGPTVRRYATREKKKRFVQMAREKFHVYCENSTLHGFRYITSPQSSILESTLWLLVCTLAIGFCVILMLRMWSNFSRNPTVTTIDTTNPIWQLPFPGVTICNNNKVYGPHAEILARVLSSNGLDYEESKKFLSSMVKLIRPDTLEVDNYTASRALDILGYSVDELMYELTQPCNSMLIRCAWIGRIFDCSKIFKAVKSKDGYCCAFNYHFDLREGYGYTNDAIHNGTGTNESSILNITARTGWLPGVKKVQMTPGAGRDVGLTVALNVEPETYSGSIRPYAGASVLIHDARDYPDIDVRYSTVLPGHVVAVALSGTGITSSEDIRRLPSEKRMCLFDGEGSAKGAYSYQSCISECMYLRIWKYCGCLPFVYPHKRVLSTYRQSMKQDCECLPQCTDISYSIVADSARIDDVGFTAEISRGLNVANVSFLYVYFGSITYLEYRKQSIMTWDSLLASFGGIFGLCVGGSVMSIVELIYYLTVDCFRKRRERRRSAVSNFLPASEMFLPVLTNETRVKRAKPIIVDPAASLEKRVFVVWSQANFQERKTNGDWAVNNEKEWRY